MTHATEQPPRTVGRYLLYGELASGGMATVHFGRLSGPVGFSRTVAIKRLHPHYAKDPEFVTMFLDEARICARVVHPNVVPTLDVVTTEGEIFIVMEYVAGEALSKLMKAAWRAGEQIPERVAASIMTAVLHGLHAAHEAKDEHGRVLGIVHRDVSPQNVIVGADGVARVLDFGVAKAAGRVQTTRDGQVKGKIAYMPPEQLAGASVNRQTDVYSASVVLWEMLAGRRLFDGETEAVVLARTIEGKIVPPSTEREGLSAALDGLVLRGLARDPSARFASAREMALALEQTTGLASAYEVGEWVERIASRELAARAARVAAVESASASAVLPPDPPHSQVSSISVSRPAVSSHVPPVPRRARRLQAAAMGALAAVLLSVVVALALSAPRSDASSAAQGLQTNVERIPRQLVVAGPTTGTAKTTARPSDGAATPARAAPSPPAPRATNAATRAPKKPAVAPGCDPPYTIDPATGRKKYNVNCL